MKKKITLNNHYVSSINRTIRNKFRLGNLLFLLILIANMLCMPHLGFASLSIASANSIRGKTPQTLDTTEQKNYDSIELKIINK